MKSLFFVAFVSAHRHHHHHGHYMSTAQVRAFGDPVIEKEFRDRNAEIAEARSNSLETRWQQTIDSIDPDLDQEMASMVLDEAKRNQAIKRFEAELAAANKSPYYVDTDAIRGNLRALKAEAKEVEKKREMIGHSEFDTPAAEKD